MSTWTAVNSIDGGNNSGWIFITEAYSINNIIQSLQPSSVIDLFELDCTSIGGDIIYFHNGVNFNNTDVVWQGITYTRYPIDVEGFERTGSGTLPRPVIKVANIMGAVSDLAYQYQDLLMSKLTRRRTFVKYLDAVNFPGGVNPTANPEVYFPDEIWSIDRKSAENGIFLEFELTTAFDVSGVLLPRRQCIQNICTWGYRSAECGWSGGAVATHNDIPTSDISADSCGKRLASCKLRFGENSELPFGGFPGVGLSR